MTENKRFDNIKNLTADEAIDFYEVKKKVSDNMQDAVYQDKPMIFICGQSTFVGGNDLEVTELLYILLNELPRKITQRAINQWCISFMKELIKKNEDS